MKRFLKVIWLFAFLLTTGSAAWADAIRQGVWEAMYFNRLHQEYVLWFQWKESENVVKYQISKFTLANNEEKEEIFCFGETGGNSILIAKDFFGNGDGIVFATKEGSSGNLTYSLFRFYPHARKLEKAFSERLLPSGSLTARDGRLIEWSGLRSKVVEHNDGQVVFKDEIVGADLLNAGEYIISLDMSSGKISARLEKIVRRKKRIITVDQGVFSSGSTLNIRVDQGLMLVRKDKAPGCESVRSDGDGILEMITPNVLVAEAAGTDRIIIKSPDDRNLFEINIKAVD